MSPRLVRIRKLVELAESEERAARARAVAAERALAVVSEEAQRAEAVWLEATRDPAVGLTRAFALEERFAFDRTLRARADAAIKRVEAAVREERARAADVVRAAIERRKLELWRDRIASEESQEESRKERMATDEVAARIALRNNP